MRLKPAQQLKEASAVHTPRPGRQKRRGVVRPRVTLRVPDHLEQYVESKVRLGVTLTDVFLDVLQLGKDIEDVLGADLYEVERQAKVEGVMPGTIMGLMLKAAIEKSRKK